MVKLKIVILIMLLIIVFNILISPNHHIVNTTEDLYIWNETFSILSSRGVDIQTANRLTSLYVDVPDSIRQTIIDIHYVESRYDSTAVSYTGDYGLGQINYGFWKEPKDSLLCADYNVKSTVDKYTMALKYARNNKYVALAIYNGSVSYLKKYEKLWNEKIDLDYVAKLKRDYM